MYITSLLSIYISVSIRKSQIILLSIILLYNLNPIICLLKKLKFK